MNENGALMVLSIDGLMAVTLDDVSVSAQGIR
jgi:hypothetical protein